MCCKFLLLDPPPPSFKPILYCILESHFSKNSLDLTDDKWKRCDTHFFFNWTFIYLVVRFLAIVWALPIKPTTLTNDIYILSSRFSLAKKFEFDTIPCFLFLSLFFFSSLLIYFSHPGTNQIMLLFLQWRRRERSVFFLNFSSVCLRRNSFRQILFSVLAFTHTHTHLKSRKKNHCRKWSKQCQYTLQ